MTVVRCPKGDCIYNDDEVCNREEIELDDTIDIFECFDYTRGDEEEIKRAFRERLFGNMV